MKAFITTVLASSLAYLPTSWADTATPDADAYKASIMAFGVPDNAAGQAASAAIDAIRQQTVAAETVAEPADVYSTISAAWLSNPYHIE